MYFFCNMNFFAIFFKQIFKNEQNYCLMREIRSSKSHIELKSYPASFFDAIFSKHYIVICIKGFTVAHALIYSSHWSWMPVITTKKLHFQKKAKQQQNKLKKKEKQLCVSHANSKFTACSIVHNAESLVHLHFCWYVFSHLWDSHARHKLADMLAPDQLCIGPHIRTSHTPLRTLKKPASNVK